MPILLPKQRIAYDYLRDDTTKYILYGGGAGGGKSWLGSEWQMMCGHHLPETRWFVGRNNIKDTLQSVLVTFKKVADTHNFSDYKYTPSGIEFTKTGAAIEFLDLTFYPYKDPLFERLGSKEYTGGWIEEAGQVHFLAFDVLKSRIGRHLNKEYNIPPKMLLTCNPKKNWLYTEIYKPYVENRLSKEYVFIPSLAHENTGLTEDYIKNLNEIKDQATKERLLLGNWEYDDDPNSLVDYDAILDMFTNSHVEGGQRFISTDIAMQGSDKFTIGGWNGLILDDLFFAEKSDGASIIKKLKALKEGTNTPNSRIVYDADGVGSFVGGFLNGAQAFHNNATPVKVNNKKLEYQNLKTQCLYLLAEYINDRKIWIKANVSERIKKEITQELEQLKSYQADKDGKLKALPKAAIKQHIGRSPDWLDMLAMRMLFELKPQKRIIVSAL